MAIASEYDVTHKCGHKQTHDLSSLPAGDRQGRARWLATTDCTSCFITKKKRANTRQRNKDRDGEAQVALEHAERDGLPPLAGTAKQTDWAVRIRHDLLRDAYDQLVAGGGMSEADYTTAILEPARLVGRAGWWIDNRHTEVGDLVEILADSGQAAEAVTNENPF